MDYSTSKRRRFQAPITTFFDSHSDDDQSSSQTYHNPSAPSSDNPPLQASLLTVGCRIRKAVPEGYKTHTTGFTPRPFMSSRLSPATLAAISAPATYSALTPYSESSINNIGGLPTLLPSQPLATATFCGIGLHNMPPSSSPYSSSSSSTHESSYANKNKRAFDDSLNVEDSDDDINADCDFIPQLPPSVFSGYTHAAYTARESGSSSMPFTSSHRRGSSYPFKHTPMPDLNMMVSSPPQPQQRTLRVPKSRVRAPPQHQTSAQAMNSFSTVDQENVHRTNDSPNFFWGFNATATSCAAEVHMENLNSQNSGGDFDFGEAGFLRRREEVEMDCS